MAKKETVKTEVKINDSATVTFVSNGKATTMPKGKEYKITGAMAKIFISAKYGDIK